MKFNVLALLVIVCVAIVNANKHHGPSRELRRSRCKNDSDCSENECCVKVAFRFLGKCRRLGRRGDRCLPRDVVDNLHQARCPCQDGLECIPKRFKETKFGEIPFRLRCVPGNATVTTQVITDEDEDVTESVVDDEVPSESPDTETTELPDSDSSELPDSDLSELPDSDTSEIPDSDSSELPNSIPPE